MNPFFQSVLIPALKELNRRCGPVKARVLAELLGLCERTVRYYLRLLEQIGIVGRPKGRRRGWCVVK